MRHVPLAAWGGSITGGRQGEASRFWDGGPGSGSGASDVLRPLSSPVKRRPLIDHVVPQGLKRANSIPSSTCLPCRPARWGWRLRTRASKPANQGLADGLATAKGPVCARDARHRFGLIHRRRVIVLPDEGQVVGLNLAARLGQDHDVFHEVLEFADVARPLVTPQGA